MKNTDCSDDPCPACALYTPGHRIHYQAVLKIFLHAYREPFHAVLNPARGEGWFTLFTADGETVGDRWTHDPQHLTHILTRNGGVLAWVHDTSFYTETAVIGYPGQPCAWINAAEEASVCEERNCEE